MTTGNGPVKGNMIGASRQFLGIPYAKPPVGALRWKAPQPPDPWTSPIDATQFGKRCAQLADPVSQSDASSDEDCLYANVWTPSPAPATALPVMVWIHGGGNTNGSASEPLPFLHTGVFYSGEFLAGNHGVIVVSFNYRLGVFGFWSGAGLAAEGSEGNQGLLDQVMAMQWVHNNIAAFGGDPNNVTVFGESAGAQDICYHVASPLSRGLFEKAISESSGCTTVQVTKASAEADAGTLAADLGCTGASADVLSCMRGKSVDEILASQDVAKGFGFGPDIDGMFLPDQPRTLYDAGQIAKVPYLLGSNTDEGTLFVDDSTINNKADYEAALATAFGSIASMVEAVYPDTNFADGQPNPDAAAFARAVGDSQLAAPTFDTAVRMSAQAPVFMYNFDIPVPTFVVPPGTFLGASHASELTFVFGTTPTFLADAQTTAATDLMQRYWTNFAKTGNPNVSGSGDPQWPAFSASQNVRMSLSFTPGVITDFRATEFAFWEGVFAAQF